MTDNSWRDSYDDWKLESPCDDGPEDECDHEEFELDILTGRASCGRCDHVWNASDAEWKRHEELMSAPYPDDDSEGIEF